MGLEIEDKLIECISYSSQQFLWSNAIFFAERLVAERNRVGVNEIQAEQSYFILASLYQSQGKFEQCFRILQTHANKPSGLLTPEARYLYALTAYKLDKIPLAQSVLFPNDDIDKVPNGAAGFYLLGLIFKKTLQKSRASEFFKKSIELNPFMWCSFESLCSLGEEVDVTSLYGSENDVTQDQLMVDATPGVTMNTSSLPRFSLSTPFQATPQTPNSPMINYDNAPSPMLFSTPGNPKTGIRKNQDTKRKVLFQSPETSSKPSRFSFTDKSVDTAKKPPAKSSTSIAKRRSSSTGTITKKESITPMPIPWTPVTFQEEENDQVATQNLLRLIRIFALGYKSLTSYQCEECILAFEKLPSNHFNTSWVLSQLGRAYYETANYQESKNMYEQSRQLDPYKTEGMEIYSTVLWHMRNDVELSYLAHEMTEIDRLSPQSWCVLGNCFSLQKEHDTAIKFFQRALQVDPSFTYAYTLCGHEYVSSDDLEKSLLCYRNALRLDDTHYNAWYGLGIIYYKQEKFELAEYHFRKAIKLNPISSVLYCYLGMVLLSNNSPEEALDILNRAIQLDPKNSLAKFKRASALVTLEEFETALSELHLLRELAPKEPPIYFLLGKIYKKLEQPEKAIQYLTIALDLDSKNSNFIKNAIEKLHHPEEEDDQELELS